MSLDSAFTSKSIYDPILRRLQKQLADRVSSPFEMRLWGGRACRFGIGEPTVDILVQDREGLAALGRLDELGICEAYMAGNLDVVGDMLGFVGLRGALSDSHPMHYLWRRIAPWILGRVATNRQAIATHYEFDNDFYLQFLDPTRCYSQAVFERDDESLETAQHRKLDFAIESCALRPGDRVLDVGCGWGSFSERAGRRGTQVTTSADIDHFKRVNDVHGHAAGDSVLAAFGGLLRAETRPTDIVARFGGEEFVVLMPHTGLERAIEVAERIRQALASKAIEPLPDPITSSFGVAEHAPGEEAGAFMGRVDAALYRAKDTGRNKVVLADAATPLLGTGRLEN